MVNEVITLREDLDLVCVDQLVKELRPFAKTQVTVTRRGYDVDGHYALRLTELGARSGDTLTVTCRGRDEAKCLAAAISILR